MADCIFCKIVAGEIPAQIVHSDDRVVAFRDIRPQAPLHLLIIPRAHIPTLSDLTQGDEALAGHILLVAKELARAHGVADSGYRIVANCNADGGQEVFHLHFHLLGGRRLSWPPG